VANGIASDGFVLSLNVTNVTPTIAAGSLNKVRVTFNQAVQVSSFTPDQAVLKNPSGVAIPVTVAVVAGSGNQQFGLSFANQTTLGNYSLTIGPNILDATGKKMDSAYSTTLSVQGLQVTASSSFKDHVRLTFNEPVDPNTLTTDQIVSFTGPAGPIDIS